MEILPCCRLSFALAAPERLSPESALNAALEHCQAQEVEEAILQSIPYSGFPAAVEALGWLRRKHPVTNSRTASSSRLEGFFDQIYGEAADKVRSSLDQRHPALAEWIEQFAYRTVMESSSLEASQIEALAVASLIGQGRMKPLHSHLRGALRTGLKVTDLEKLLESLEPVAHRQVLDETRELLLRESGDS